MAVATKQISIVGLPVGVSNNGMLPDPRDIQNSLGAPTNLLGDTFYVYLRIKLIRSLGRDYVKH